MKNWIAAACRFAAAGARGETWEKWLAPDGQYPLKAELKPAWDVEVRGKDAGMKPSAYVERNRGYEGEMEFALAEGAEKPRGPLTIVVRHVAVSGEDIDWPQNKEIPAGYAPMVLPGAAAGPAVATETFEAEATFPLRVPIARPKSSASENAWNPRKPGALFGQVEARDADGRTIYRGTLPGQNFHEMARALVGTAEGDESARQASAHSGEIDRVNDLPEAMEAYRRVRGIWFTESLWKTMEGKEALARRLLLSGVRLSGETGLVEKIRETLGTGKDGRAVAAVAMPSALWPNNEFELRRLDLAQMEGAKKGSKPVRERSALDNDGKMFADDLDAIENWTLGGLLIHAAGTAAAFAYVFSRRRREGRVAIWWILPAWAGGCAGAIWLGGLLALDRRPRAEITEYRLAMAGWPEMHCRAVATAMTFEPGRTTWRLPQGAWVAGFHQEQLDGWWGRLDAETTDRGMRLILPRKATGTTLQLDACWFESAAFPVALEDGDLDAPGRWAVASEAVDGAYVLANGEWRDLGPMKAGDRIDPLGARKTKHNGLPGLPATLREVHAKTIRRDGNLDAPDEARAGRGDWLVVAWKRDPQPRVAPEWAAARTKGRTIWVVQWP